MARSIGSKRPNVIGSKWPDDLTENTTEITTENKNTSRPEASQPDPQTAEQDFLTRHPDAVVFSAKKTPVGKSGRFGVRTVDLGTNRESLRAGCQR
ncbi:ybl78 [Escherichia coli]|uniref:Ybl78 n=1 Tax=Escherichia coli TaxID=562 RepID=A0A376ZT69_ECOLX|nr:ybl78 [Escherichia coli]